MEQIFISAEGYRDPDTGGSKLFTVRTSEKDPRNARVVIDACSSPGLGAVDCGGDVMRCVRPGPPG